MSSLGSGKRVVFFMLSEAGKGLGSEMGKDTSLQKT